MKELSERNFQLADDIILDLDTYARDVDKDVFGLPCSDSHLEKLRTLVMGRLNPGDKKVCLLINAPNSWILDVDGKRISFYGSENAEYFADMYGGLGYRVVWQVIES